MLNFLILRAFFFLVKKGKTLQNKSQNFKQLNITFKSKIVEVMEEHKFQILDFGFWIFNETKVLSLIFGQ